MTLNIITFKSINLDELLARNLIGVGVIAAEAAVGVSSHDSSFREGFHSQE